jgi:hypothetical protein
LVELQESQYKRISNFLKNNACDTVAAYAIIENRQRGRVFVNNLESPSSVLFWHYSGFAMLSGDSTDDNFNKKIYKLLLGDFENNQRRFALVVDNGDWNKQILNLIGNDTQISKNYRLKFKFNASLFTQKNYIVPAGYELKVIDDNIINKIQGTIIPSFIWDTSQAFLTAGKGFCLMHDNNIACTAFSSYIGNGQMDIGIETTENYRRKGLGVVTASAMVSYSLKNGFEPVWGCAENNIGSKSIAQKLGFKLIDAHPLYIKS